jgi:hypothetical protein
MKANYGAGGDVFMLRWLRGAFDLMSSKVMGPEEGAPGAASQAGESAVAAIPSTGSVIDDAILSGVAELAADGVALSKAHNSPHWAPRVLLKRSDVLGLYPIDDVAAGWDRVVKAGRVVVAVVGRKPINRHPIVGFKVADSIPPAPSETGESIFE